MSEDKITNGQIQIADEVIGVIAVTAALEVDGVTEGAGSGKGFVEFFGKFYEGGGRPFEPFQSDTKYVDIKEETLS